MSRLKQATVILGRPGLAGKDGAAGPAGTGINAIQATDITNATTTQTPITKLTFPISANEKWLIEFVVGTGCSSTGGVTFQLGAPAGCSVSLAGMGSGSSQSNLIVNYTATGVTPAFNTGNFYNGQVHFTAVVRNGATAGTIVLKMAAGVAGQTATVYTDSSMSARPAS